jgi:hypothetical protein
MPADKDAPTPLDPTPQGADSQLLALWLRVSTYGPVWRRETELAAAHASLSFDHPGPPTVGQNVHAARHALGSASWCTHHQRADRAQLSPPSEEFRRHKTHKQMRGRGSRTLRPPSTKGTYAAGPQ